jgi:hypothetical protein
MDRPWGRIERSSDLGRSAAPVNGSLPPVREREEEVWGVLTVVGGGRHGDGARPVTSFIGGGYLLSMTRGSGRGETKVGVALDAVESGRGVGAFYGSVNGERWAVKE